MAQGKVKWFNSRKGFGFIEQEDGPDLFVHHKAIQGGGFKDLNEGDIVEYSVTSGPRGGNAVDVRVVSRGTRMQTPASSRNKNHRQDKPFNRSIEDQLKALRKSSKENQQDLANRLKRR
ncbi:MAG: cold shock domain-containing protein [Actinobacteria bacterium]|nr:cold shock domain-containing protein [Actinomycetota bacterium]